MDCVDNNDASGAVVGDLERDIMSVCMSRVFLQF